MNKEIKDRLDKLENELKESKNEIHSLKSSVSLTIERGIRKLLSRFTRKQLILGSVIALFSISIIGIAGTVSKTYTFSSGEVVSASKFNTNFDTLFTLVNGNLDDNNISGISGSKITSGTVAAARLDNLSGSMITSGTVAAARLDNLSGSMITSGTVAAARLDNLSGSMITSGTVAAARLDNLSASMITSGIVSALYMDNFSASKITSGTLSLDRIPDILPIGSIVAWHEDLKSGLTLTSNWLKCDGQTVNDSDSVFNGLTLPDLNGVGRFLRGSSTSGTEQESSAIGGWTGNTVTVENDDGNLGSAYPDGYKGLGGATINQFKRKIRPVNMSVVWIIKIK